MQELGFTRDSLYIQDVLTPIKTKVLMLDTGEVKESETSKTFRLNIGLENLYKETSITQEAVQEAVKKYQKTTLTFKDKRTEKRNLLQCNSKSRFFGRWKKH